MATKRIDLTLIIATRNRAASLQRALDDLLTQKSRRHWELIVVDNGSTDQTNAVLEEFGDRFRGPFQRVFEPRPGLANAHNAGLRAASGAIIAFTDDDCYLAPGHLDAIFDCFAEDESIGFLGGRILLHDPTDYRITVQESERRLVFAPSAFLRCGIIQGANFACRRTALDDAGGCDPLFGPGSYFNAEEMELLARISAKGWFGVYDPRPTVYHHHGRKTLDEARKLMSSYDYGRGAYYARCLMNRRLRMTYLKNWFWSLRGDVRGSRLRMAMPARLQLVCRFWSGIH